MHVANEGVLVAVVAPEHAEAALAALRAAGAPGEFGEAAEIGEVKTEPARHGARGDGVRRQAGHGPARR